MRGVVDQYLIIMVVRVIHIYGGKWFANKYIVEKITPQLQ